MDSIFKGYRQFEKAKKLIFSQKARIALLAPVLIFLIVMMAFPVLYTLYLSFHQWSGSRVVPPTFVGVGNYIQLLTERRFIMAVWRTIYYTGAAVSIEMAIGIIAAVTFNTEFKGKSVVRTIFLLPIMATPVAISLTWSQMFSPVGGVLNYILNLLHLPPSNWASHPRTVILSLVMVDVWKWTPLVMLIVLAGLAALPREPFESAMIDGANRWQIFFLITMPLLKSSIIIALIFRTIDALKTFDIIYAITEGGPGFASETLNIFCYKQSFTYFKMGYASAALVIFFSIILGFSAILIKMWRRRT